MRRTRITKPRTLEEGKKLESAKTQVQSFKPREVLLSMMMMISLLQWKGRQQGGDQSWRNSKKERMSSFNRQTRAWEII
jgi:hypothetical protein